MARSPSPTDSFETDAIRAVDAFTEAQRIAFAPLAFQAAKALRDFGILADLADVGESGRTVPELQARHAVSAYGLRVLLEMGLSMGIVKLGHGGERFLLGKIGHVLQFDAMTRANLDFVADVCYRGAESLAAAIQTGTPAGLSVFGPWSTIYEGLSTLPEPARTSWFAFDHFYSDAAFGHALPLVFAHKPQTLLDIGGNTARWALACHRFDPDVRVTIVDLPGQLAVAAANIALAGASDRVSTHAVDVLDPEASFPPGADAIWMSQFLDCFSLPEVTAIARRVAAALSPNGQVFVLEPLWDQQRFAGATYALHATSLYFTCMANGNSRMYRLDDLVGAIAAGGLTLAAATHRLGPRDYSLLQFRRSDSAQSDE